MYIGLYKTPNIALSCLVTYSLKNITKAPSSTSLEFQIIDLYNSLQRLRSLITPLPLPLYPRNFLSFLCMVVCSFPGTTHAEVPDIVKFY